MKIIPMLNTHWPEVSSIYAQGMDSRMATFETQMPDWEDWNENHHPHCRLVAEGENGIVGWAALLPVSKREVYKGVAEVSIYIHVDFRGKGIGKELMDALIAESEKQGIWMLQSALFPENIASVKLHQSCGFREIGFKEKVAKLDGNWKDTLLMERRSKLQT